MLCPDTDKIMCEVKASFIRQEIDNSFKHIKSQKVLSLNVIKIYLLILYVLIAYTLIHAKIQKIENAGDNLVVEGPVEHAEESLKQVVKTSKEVTKSEGIIFPIIGIIFTLFVFLVGWALLSYLSHIIAGIRKSFRHINSMRGLKANAVQDFEYRSLMPVTENNFAPIYSDDLPRIFGIVNLFVLFLDFYFLRFIIRDHKVAFVITIVTICVLSIWYLRTIRNFYLTIKKSDLVKPSITMDSVEAQLKRYITNIREMPYFKYMRFGRKVTGMGVAVTFTHYLYKYYFDSISLLISFWLILGLVTCFVFLAIFEERFLLSKLPSNSTELI